MNKIKLFCFPYAGGSSAAYIGWKKYLSDKIELRPLDLAGRGRRINEPLYNSIEEVIEDIFPRIQNELCDSPYCIFGHSMGSILAYELVRKARMLKLREPEHVFFSGRMPPFIISKTQNHLLSDSEFIKLLEEFGGMNNEILSNQQLLSLFLPIIRADYRIVELYKHTDDGFKLNCDITVLNGKWDKLANPDVLGRWRECTDKSCNFFEFDGGHFFINDFKPEILNIINNTISQII
ncbi:thioesterase II family protein [Acetivibrio straminisolvens]|uniref:Thioesterase n=1 Tax=Acetivibrio straminisolvens JCM 21531 TaxID=1294263 RepID=W4V1L8_9FIRM|nr:thioesterase domain-containing protein [Acetivibrio straminisolvens]GAE87116.1 thioesterase [Acetivibrio straminisolvens JCM 21531]